MEGLVVRSMAVVVAVVITLVGLVASQAQGPPVKPEVMD
jgi:hypothetical protein